MDNSTNTQFSEWAIIELMGRQQIAGLVSERTIASSGFLQVDVYDEKGEKVLFSRLIAPGSVYAINPVEKDVAIAFAAKIMTRPVYAYQLRNLLPQPDHREESIDDFWPPEEPESAIDDDDGNDGAGFTY